MAELEKKRILAWGDYCCATGFGKVMSEIMQELQKTGKYEIDVVAINYDGSPYDPERWPGRVWPAMSPIQPRYGDVFGRQRLLDLLGSQLYDVVFMLQDTFIVQQFMPHLVGTRDSNPKKPKFVYYFPIDAAPIKKDWVEEVVAQMDFPVAYTEFGKHEVQKWVPDLKMDVVYHGTNTKDFFPIDNYAENKAFKETYFNNKADGKFLLTNVNRNQSRKDVARSLAILKEIKDRGHNDVLLYMHMQHDDVGGNLLVMADNFGLHHGEDFIFPENFGPNHGIPVDVVNRIYNISDCVLTTTLGEGWGLSITEAMATKTPVVAPDNTSISEILGNNRGILVPCGGKSLWITKESDNERLRPLTDVEAAADAIIKLKEKTQQPDLDSAYKWVQEYTWEKIAKRWVEIIDRATAPPPLPRQQRRALERQAAKDASISL